MSSSTGTEADGEAAVAVGRPGGEEQEVSIRGLRPHPLRTHPHAEEVQAPGAEGEEDAGTTKLFGFTFTICLSVKPLCQCFVNFYCVGVDSQSCLVKVDSIYR